MSQARTAAIDRAAAALRHRIFPPRTLRRRAAASGRQGRRGRCVAGHETSNAEERGDPVVMVWQFAVVWVMLLVLVAVWNYGAHRNDSEG